jgi:hypothetical protein
MSQVEARNRQSRQWLDYRIDVRGIAVVFPVGKTYLSLLRIFLGSGAQQHPIQWVRDAPSPDVKQPGRETDHIIRLAPRLRIPGAKTPLPYIPSRRAYR